jgi:hypothetical protein
VFCIIKLLETEVIVQTLFSIFKLAKFHQYTQLPCVKPELAVCFRDSSCLDNLSETFDNKVEGRHHVSDRGGRLQVGKVRVNRLKS